MDKKINNYLKKEKKTQFIKEIKFLKIYSRVEFSLTFFLNVESRH